MQKPVEIVTPQLPPSPAAIETARQDREASRGELLKLLGVYTQLRRTITPAYQLASAHGELAAGVGAIGADSSQKQLHEALDWLRRRLTELAARHPDQAKAIARERRRMALSA